MPLPPARPRQPRHWLTPPQPPHTTGDQRTPAPARHPGAQRPHTATVALRLALPSAEVAALTQPRRFRASSTPALGVVARERASNWKRSGCLPRNSAGRGFCGTEGAGWIVTEIAARGRFGVASVGGLALTPNLPRPVTLRCSDCSAEATAGPRRKREALGRGPTEIWRHQARHAFRRCGYAHAWSAFAGGMDLWAHPRQQ